jgi:hypothetical protein
MAEKRTKASLVMRKDLLDRSDVAEAGISQSASDAR